MNAPHLIHDAQRLINDKPTHLDDWRFTEAWIARGCNLLRHLTERVQELENRKPLSYEQHMALYDGIKYEGDDGWEIDWMEYGQAVEREHRIMSTPQATQPPQEATLALHQTTTQPAPLRLLQNLLLRIERAAASLREQTCAAARPTTARTKPADTAPEGQPLDVDLRNPAVCIGCGCTDAYGCKGGCHWLAVDRNQREGVCSHCADHLPAFQARLDALNIWRDGWLRYEKARSLSPSHWARLQQQHRQGLPLDTQIDALDMPANAYAILLELETRTRPTVATRAAAILAPVSPEWTKA